MKLLGLSNLSPIDCVPPSTPGRSSFRHWPQMCRLLCLPEAGTGLASSFPCPLKPHGVSTRHSTAGTVFELWIEMP